jgi:hypothetical protein
MLRILLLISIVLMQTACGGFEKPDVQAGPGKKILMGSFKLEAGHTGNDPLPGSLSMHMAPVKLGVNDQGRVVPVGEGRVESYVLKSAWTPSVTSDSLTYFLPIEPGIYSIKELKFQFGGPVIMGYNFSLGKGMPLIVSPQTDATYVGQLVIKMKYDDPKKKPSGHEVSLISEPQTTALFLAHHPGATVKEILLPIKNSVSDTHVVSPSQISISQPRFK